MIYTKEEILKMNWIDRGKYKAIYIPTHHRSTNGYVYVHILMMESKLKRYLKHEEVVHHIDEDKFNNTYENLICFKTKSDHTSFHKGGKLVFNKDEENYYCERVEHKCEKCGKKIDKKGMCVECYNILRSKDIPSKEVLKSLIRSKSFCAIGQEYGVTDNAVRKWCKKYKLPHTKTKIKDTSNEDWSSL